MKLGDEFMLDVSGLGIVMYSPSSASHISPGEDYLASHYLTAEQVQPHIQAGTLVGFGTGSPGTFLLRLRSGYPTDARLTACEHKLRLGVRVKDRTLCFRDLYDLMDWAPSCPEDQTLEIEDGWYHVTLSSDAPASGVLGDRQVIEVHLARLDAMPRLAAQGIPKLCG